MPNISGKRDTPFSFYLPHPQTFSPKILASFRRKAALGNLKANFHCARLHFLCRRSDTLQLWRYVFLDMALPIHNFTYIQAYRAKSVKLRQPSRYLLIHPSHNILHFIVYHINFIEIPTNCFIMIYPIAQATEFV